MNKKIISFLIALALFIPTLILVSGCNKTVSKIKAKDVYAFSALSSVEYLENMDEMNISELNSSNATSRPSIIEDKDVQGIKDCLTMFDSILNNGYKQSTKENDSQQEDLSIYKFKMTISIPQSNETLTMYYDEIDAVTKVDIEEGEEETSTRLQGILVAGDRKFDVFGEKEVEKERNEIEISVEFTTKSRVNPNNYIEVSQSFENDEIEYEYKIFENGRKVQDLEVEYESEKSKTELEFQLKDLTSGVFVETKYKVNAITQGFRVIVQKNRQTETITVEKLENGYKFTYLSNGFVENV